jgi:glycosyltransferase involved in cell wall biosynthesis
MKALHITNWYPNEGNEFEAIWIQRQIEALSPYIEGYFVLHLEVKPSDRLRLIRRDTDHLMQRRVEIPIKAWAITELFTAVLLAFYWIKLRPRKFDVINFHIAYPLLSYWHVLKRLFRVPVVITEHWSAYHFNFGVSREKGLPRIRRIFQEKIPVIVVSEALARDIKDFTKADFPSWVVPNVVDESIFYPDDSIRRDNYFFMVSQWKWPKQPLVVFEAFRNFIEFRPDFRLLVGGYGSDYSVLEKWIETNNMKDAIFLLGALKPLQIADLYKRCYAFFHATEYETFSVVCAEAISCHTPVVASKVGGIPELIDGEGLLVENAKPELWTEMMKAVLIKTFSFRTNRFGRREVGRRYADALSDILRNSI